MNTRSFAVALAAAGFVLFEPAAVRADKFKPPFDDTYGGIVREDASCPAATHVLWDVCNLAPRYYLAFHRAKGIKRFVDGYVTVSGPTDTTSCSLPVIDVEKIGFVRVPPPPCGP